MIKSSASVLLSRKYLNRDFGININITLTPFWNGQERISIIKLSIIYISIITLCF